MPATVIE